MTFFKKILVTAAVSAVFCIYSCGQPLAFTDLLGEELLSSSGDPGTPSVQSDTNVNYSNIVIELVGSTQSGGELTGYFNFKNSGTDPGTQDVDWKVYISEDGTLGVGDTLIATGTYSFLEANSISDNIDFSGTWPATIIEKDFNILVFVSAEDDFIPDDDSGLTTISVSAMPAGVIDYTIENISNNPSAYSINQPFTQSFILTNLGSAGGSSSVVWEVFISGDSELDDNDEQCDNGIEQALSSGESVSIPFSGLWPEDVGTYYLIVEVSAYDDIIDENNIIPSSAFTISNYDSAVDYVITDLSVSDNGYLLAASFCEGTFVITNLGDENGGSGISWSVYISDDDSLDITDDDEIGGSGETPHESLDAGYSSDVISLNGRWPAGVGSYYLKVKIDSEDEDDEFLDNNVIVSGPFTVNSPPDYIIDSPQVIFSDELPGDPLSNDGTFEFSIAETAGSDGNQQIGWEVYVSLDTSFDSNDYLLTSGSLGPLGDNETYGPIPFGDDAFWPELGSYYYIIINITSGDDIEPNNNTWVSTKRSLPSVYNEGSENNSSSWQNGTVLPNVSSLDDGQPGSGFLVGELRQINGIGDASGAFDTYQFSASEISTVLINVEWETGSNGIELILWDSVTPSPPDRIAESWDNSYDEDSLIYTELVPDVLYYLGISFVQNMTGIPYTVTLYGSE